MSDVDLTMPQLGETVTEGTVLRWLVEEGSSVQAQDPVLEVSTDKVDTEVVAPVSGLLRRIAVPEGSTVPVGTVIASIGVATPTGPSSVPDSDLTEEGLASAQSRATRVPPTPAPSSSGRRHRHSPRVRRLAREHGVDLDQLRPAGRGGRVTPSDVLLAAREHTAPAAAEALAPAPEHPSPPGHAPSRQPTRGRVERLSRRRQVIAERMHRSLQDTAQLTTVVEVDLTPVVGAREAAKDAFRQRYGASLSVLAFVARAAVRALDAHPVLNAELDLANGTVTYPSGVDLGIAVDTREGLVVPVIRGADDLTVGALARRIGELALRSREGTATADDYAGGTFTITNTGSRGALFDTPILNAPQSAILGLGAVVRRPAALLGGDGQEVLAVRSMAYLSLTYDHRLIDGADAARYLETLKGLLESPSRGWQV